MKFKLLVVLGLAAVSAAQTVDFKLHRGFLIVVKCSISNKDLAAVIDTGVTETAIDIKLAKRLRLPTRFDQATFGTRQSQVSAVSIPELVVGPLRKTMIAGIAIDMSGFEHQLGIHADVIVGMDVLGQSSFLIDYESKKINFGMPPSLKYASPVATVNHLLLVAAEVEKTDLTFQLDTGFNAILVYGNRLPVSTPGSDSRSETILGGMTVRLTAHSIKIGDWQGRQIAVAVTDEAPGGEKFFDGLLGPSALGARRFAFDKERHLVLWE